MQIPSITEDKDLSLQRIKQVLFDYNYQPNFTLEKASCINPLMPGSNKKVTHT